MFYESANFQVFMIILSIVFLFLNGRALPYNFSKCKADMDEQIEYANRRFGPYSIGVFTGVTIAITVGYVFCATLMGKIPQSFLYVIVGFQIVDVFLEYMVLKGFWKYTKFQFIYDKIDRTFATGLACWVAGSIILG